MLSGCAAPSSAPQASAPLPADAPVSLAVAGAPAITGTEFKELTGLGEKELRRRLGAPDFRRREAAAQIWQYRSAECVLDLFLYRSAGQYRVAYAETHSRGAVAVPQSSCYAGLLARHPRIDESRL